MEGAANLSTFAGKPVSAEDLQLKVERKVVEPVTGLKVLIFGAVPAVVQKASSIVAENKFDPASKVVLANSDETKPLIIEALKSEKWDVVLTGKGIYNNSDLLTYIINASHKFAPGAIIALPDNPADIQQSVARAWRESYTF